MKGECRIIIGTTWGDDEVDKRSVPETKTRPRTNSIESTISAPPSYSTLSSRRSSVETCEKVKSIFSLFSSQNIKYYIRYCNIVKFLQCHRNMMNCLVRDLVGCTWNEFLMTSQDLKQGLVSKKVLILIFTILLSQYFKIPTSSMPYLEPCLFYLKLGKN